MAKKKDVIEAVAEVEPEAAPVADAVDVAEPPQAAEWVFRGKPFTQLMLPPGLGYPGEWAIRFAEDGRYHTRRVEEANALRAYQAQGGPVREEV